MKRIVICYDGTWNAVKNSNEVTNVVKVAQAVRSKSSTGVTQVTYYNAGVGSGGPIDRFLGGVFGVGLRNNVKRGLAFLSLNWDSQDDEIYIFGFSRGAYTARALAGVIGAIKGIPWQSSFSKLEDIWNHYRKGKGDRARDEAEISELICPMPNEMKPIIKCVAIWDTVGSYGIPSGFGLGALARYVTSGIIGFHDKEIGDHIQFALHAMAIDERRRAFPSTAWLIDEEKSRTGVEQVWFAGSHSDVGGGYPESGLSDLALIWMMARVEELTELEFDKKYIQEYFWPCWACSLHRSYRRWPVSTIWPSRRPVASGVREFVPGSGAKGTKIQKVINEKVHWSVKDRLDKLSLVDRSRLLKYSPQNQVGKGPFTEHTELEDEFISLCRNHLNNKKKSKCALFCNLVETEKGRRARRLRKLRDVWRSR